jgi:exonuclease SbcD
MSSRAPLSVCCDFLSHVRGGSPPSGQERVLLEEALGRSREGRAAAQDEGQVGAA